MNPRDDKLYFDGWYDGYNHAIDDVRQELLTLEADRNAPVPIEIYVTLNQLKEEGSEKNE